MRSHSKYITGLILLLIVLTTGLVGTVKAGGDPRLRVMNAAPDAPPADVYLDGARIISNLGYKAVSGYHALTPGTHRIKVNQAGSGPDAPGVIEADLSFADGEDYTLVAMGQVQSLEFRQFRDDNSPPEATNKAKVRFIHTSMDLGAVDVCGTGQANCFVANLTYTNATSYAVTDAGTFSLDLRQTGSNNLIRTFPNAQFKNGEVYTVFIVGLLNNGAWPLDVVMTTDARWEPNQPPTTGAFLSPTAQVVVLSIFLGLIAGAWLVWRQVAKLRAAS